MSADEHEDGMNAALARSIDILREDVPVRAGWRADLLARIEGDRSSAPSGWRMRPSLAIAAGIVLLVSGIVIGRSIQPSLPAVAANDRPVGVATVRFVYVAPGAANVSLVGDFNQWNPTAMPLRRLGDGTWIADVPLTPGRYAYAFVVDGKVVVDPSAPKAAGDFGENSIVMVRGS